MNRANSIKTKKRSVYKKLYEFAYEFVNWFTFMSQVQLFIKIISRSGVITAKLLSTENVTFPTHHGSLFSE